MLTVSHTFEPAASGRAKCRGCGRAFARGETRFGERLPNPFAEGEMTVWFTRRGAAYKRPDPVLQTLAETSAEVPDREVLERVAHGSMAQRRMPRIDGAEQAPGAQARCRHCHEPIARGTWRIRLVFYQDGRFAPGGFVHLDCRKAYFETDDILEHVLHFSPGLSAGERAELTRALGR
jgi:hypothetical protein